MSNKTIVLGAGISALVYKYYHPNAVVIGKEVGGKLKNSFMENIIYLHATLETKKFLQELGLHYTEKTQLIKYEKDNMILTDITKDDKIQMIRKKLADENYNPVDLNLSVSDYYISIYEVDLQTLLDKLTKNISIIQDNVIRITDKEVITENSRYEYDSIISTLPANVFWKLYFKPVELELKSLPVTFVLADKEPEFLVGTKYDLVYILDADKMYTRVSKKNDKFLYEFTGVVDEIEIKKQLPVGSTILSSYVDKCGIIFSNEKNIPPQNIQFLGRFATWNHVHKIMHVIEFSQWNYDFRQIWNRQKQFTQQVMDLHTTHIADKEKQTQLLLLHLFEEMSEVLAETNYKLHKPQHDVDAAKIKEELLDIFKYLLNLFLVWNVDCAEFVRLFNEKSAIVEQRYAKVKEQWLND